MILHKYFANFALQNSKSMIFCLDLSVTTIILTALSLVCLTLVIITYVLRVKRVARYARRQNEDLPDFDDPERTIDDKLEPASIVVYAQDQAENLSQLLPQLLGQDYKPGFEVIVVNEGESEATRDIVDTLRITHHNLYLTFTPDGARNLSRKKLALMLGIKAARNRVVVNTTAGVLIDSPHWLETMMRNFTDESVEVVLGYALPCNTDTGVGKRCRAFDIVADGVTWLTSAIAGKPYRGTEFNVAYTRDIFFRNKGFSRSLNLRHGDDDIFISEIATRYNTAVELSEPSIVRCNFYNHSRELGELHRRHEFTGRFITRSSRRLMAFGAWMMWLTLASSITAAIVALPNLFAASIAAVIILAMFIVVSLTWRNAMRTLGSRSMFFPIFGLALTLPVRRIMRAMKYRMHKGRNYTWNN
jgi:glycosyltransferase involved in cell wall biosynthesis